MKTTFVAVGDCFITRRIPERGYEGFDELKDLIKSHDVKFANLEQTFHDQEGYPSASSGGTWAMAERNFSMKSPNSASTYIMSPTTIPATTVRAESLPPCSISKNAK